MARRKRALLGTLATLAATALVSVLVLLPRQPIAAPQPDWKPPAPSARGVYHIHTVRSDGTGTIDQIAAAAARAGLDFIVITDHGDATRRPDPPSYRSGVLCIDAVEISTAGGHYAALGLGAAPYPLGGEPRDVAEDVRRLGGFGIAAHPLSPKRGLAWSGWDAPVDAVEWLNLDSVWRDAPLPRLLSAAWTYPFRQVASVAALYRRPAALIRWDELSSRTPVVGLAGADAHARLGFSEGREPYTGPVYLRLPSYQTLFEVASLRVTLARPLEQDAERAAESIVGAIRAGRVHTVVDALGWPAWFEFTASGGEVSAAEGGALPVDGPVVVRARANLPPGGWMVLFRNGAEVHRVADGELVYATDRAGVYRAEVWLPAARGGAFVPWIVGNPIYVGRRQASVEAPVDSDGPSTALEPTDRVWGVERDRGSEAELDRSADGVALHFALDSAPASAPFAALDATTTIPAGATGLAFRGRADRPMRISVQLRVVTAGEGKRWQRSIYLDEVPRDFVIPFTDMRPTGALADGPPEVAEVRTVLFVADTVNTPRGGSGRFLLEKVRFFSPGDAGR